MVDEGNFAGETDSSGNLKIVSAAESGETPGENEGEGDANAVTDSAGNIMCKFYA